MDERPGVSIKGERKFEGEDETYNLSDYEEDGMFPKDGADDASSPMSPDSIDLPEVGHDDVYCEFPPLTPLADLNRPVSNPSDMESSSVDVDKASAYSDLSQTTVCDKINEPSPVQAALDNKKPRFSGRDPSILQRYAGNIALAGSDSRVHVSSNPSVHNNEACVIS